MFVMKYEDLLTTQDALLNALTQLRVCRHHSELVRETVKYGEYFTIAPKDFDAIIDETQNAYNMVSHEIFEYEWELNHSIAANSDVLFGANVEDVPF